MAKKLKAHTPVELDFVDSAPNAPHLTYRFSAPASAVWAALLDERAYTEWLAAITNLTWTSPKPFQVGTTRTVEMGNDKVEEVFLAWDEGRRMAFRFERSTFPVSAGVEDYQVVEVPGGCELRWTARLSGMFPLPQLIHFMMKRGLNQGLPKLEALIKNEPARFGVKA